MHPDVSRERALAQAVELPDLVEIPEPAVRAQQRFRIPPGGDPTSPTRRYEGCRFRVRCPLYASGPGEEERKRCAHDVPLLEGDAAACRFSWHGR